MVLAYRAGEYHPHQIGGKDRFAAGPKRQTSQSEEKKQDVLCLEFRDAAAVLLKEAGVRNGKTEKTTPLTPTKMSVLMKKGEKISPNAITIPFIFGKLATSSGSARTSLSERLCRLWPPILDFPYKRMPNLSVCGSSSETRPILNAPKSILARGGQSWQQPVPRRKIPSETCSSARCIPNCTDWRDGS
jgi:hypothetical protein